MLQWEIENRTVIRLFCMQQKLTSYHLGNFCYDVCPVTYNFERAKIGYEISTYSNFFIEFHEE